MRLRCVVRCNVEPNGSMSPYPRLSQKMTMIFGSRVVAAVARQDHALRQAIAVSVAIANLVGFITCCVSLIQSNAIVCINNSCASKIKNPTPAKRDLHFRVARKSSFQALQNRRVEVLRDPVVGELHLGSRCVGFRFAFCPYSN